MELKCDKRRTLALFDLVELKQVLELQPNYYYGPSSSYCAHPIFSPDGQTMLFNPTVKVLRLWGLQSGQAQGDLNLPVDAPAVFCKPPTSPVGMDIYLMGSYSFEKNAVASLRCVRDQLALSFADPIAKVTLASMRHTVVGGADALYLEGPATEKPDVIWRQWAFIQGSRAYVVVSALKYIIGDDGKFLPNIDAWKKWGLKG